MKVFHTDRTGHLYVYQDKDETLDYEIDWTSWLDGDTIDSVANSASGVSVTSSSNTTTANTIWVQGTSGEVTTTITTASGRIKQKTIKFRERVN
jgi:hypothetical protein